MKIFCSHAFTGEDPKAVTERMQLVVDELRSNGHDVYCDLFDQSVVTLMKSGDVKAILRDAFSHLASCDVVVAIVTSPRRSVGQSMELGVALHDNKPIYLFEHVSAKNSTYLEQIADTHHSWETDEQLRDELRKSFAR
jgi:nucleoside 2-deoxyribosyltransferase